MSMTRMERRRQKRLYVITCISVIVAIISVLVMIAVCVSFAAKNSKRLDMQSRVIYSSEGQDEPAAIETTEIEPEEATEDVALEPMEDPYETEHINEALFRMGYLREDIPLSIGDQLALRASSDFHGIPYSLCLAIVEGESNFDVNNDDGTCYGLCGLHRDYFPDNLSSQENIRYGMECLAGKIEEYGGDVLAALEAYWYGHDDGRRGYPNYILAFADKWKSLGVDTYEEAG